MEIDYLKDTNDKVPFDDWLRSLRDKSAKSKIYQKLARIRQGNLGVVEPVGEGISEIKIYYGPGYRIYFVNIGKDRILIIYGGDKSTQEKDIKKAKELYKKYKEEK